MAQAPKPIPTAVPVVQEFRGQLQKMEDQFRAALPPHIPAERFTRVVLTAVQNNPKLLNCTRQSLFNAAMQAAQDGLLPDNREGAIIIFNEDDDGRKSDTARWLPMVAGIRKKVRNSGALADWNVQVVHDGDFFDFQLGDAPFIEHKPSMRGGRNRRVIAAYSIATYPDGTKSREVMNADELEDIRKLSRSKKGPWSNPIFYPEMCRKTVARLHSKQLPMSTDLDTLMRRDDDLYDFKGAREESKRLADKRPSTIAAALDYFGGGPGNGQPPTDDTPPADDTPPLDEAPPVGEPPAPPSTPPTVPATSSAAPRNEAEYSEFVRGVTEQATDADELTKWFASDGQRKLRNACGVLAETYKTLATEVSRKATDLRNTRESVT